MARLTRRAMRLLMALAVLGALSFGAREAWASVKKAPSCTDCQGVGETPECDFCCGGFGVCPTGGGECLCG